MKKGALISSVTLVVIGLTAFTYQNLDSNLESNMYTCTVPELKVQESPIVSLNPISHLFEKKPELNFFYDYGPRFRGISKMTLENAISITDLYQDEDIKDIVSYGKVSLILIRNESQSDIQEFSEGTLLTEAQRELLKSLDYSASFNLRSDCNRFSSKTDKVENSFHSPHFTIVPEKQAIYLDGRDALIQFLADGSSSEKALVEENRMRPAMINFTVTKKGRISKVKIRNHSGYDVFDAKMIELINILPGKWKPAENADGEKVDQELVVSWGFDGC